MKISTEPNAVIAAKEPVRRKRGGQPGNTNAFELSSHTQRAVFDRAISTFIKQLNLVLEEISDEKALDEP